MALARSMHDDLRSARTKFHCNAPPDMGQDVPQKFAGSWFSINFSKFVGLNETIDQRPRWSGMIRPRCHLIFWLVHGLGLPTRTFNEVAGNQQGLSRFLGGCTQLTRSG